jgi:hypothetical protein
MATYKQIDEHVRSKLRRSAKTCWIAHCKELKGLPVRRAHNRKNDTRQVPCNDLEMRKAIFDAFRQFEMI